MRAQRTTAVTSTEFNPLEYLSVTSKCIRYFYGYSRRSTARIPIERAGKVVTHTTARITETGPFEFIMGIPIGRAECKVYLEIMVKAEVRSGGGLYWRLYCPRCGEQRTYLYLVSRELLCQDCGCLSDREKSA